MVGYIYASGRHRCRNTGLGICRLMPSKNGTTPNRFESELDDYPGFFTLPSPFTDTHMRVWWKHAIAPLKELSRLDYETYDGEWAALVELIREYGEWSIKAVPPGDLDKGAMPMAVKAWAMEVGALYIYPFLPPKARRLALVTM